MGNDQERVIPKKNGKTTRIPAPVDGNRETSVIVSTIAEKVLGFILFSSKHANPDHQRTFHHRRLHLTHSPYVNSCFTVETSPYVSPWRDKKEIRKVIRRKEEEENADELNTKFSELKF